MEWIIVLVIVGVVLSRGGDWFDVLSAESRYQYWRTDLEFYGFFAILCCALIAGAIWLYAESMKPEPAVSPTYKAQPAEMIHPKKGSKHHQHPSHHG